MVTLTETCVCVYICICRFISQITWANSLGSWRRTTLLWWYMSKSSVSNLTVCDPSDSVFLSSASLNLNLCCTPCHTVSIHFIGYRFSQSGEWYEEKSNLHTTATQNPGEHNWLCSLWVSRAALPLPLHSAACWYRNLFNGVTELELSAG